MKEWNAKIPSASPLSISIPKTSVMRTWTIVFGEVSLYVPKIWKVQVRMDHSFGSVEEKGRCEGSSDISLDIIGDTDFGTVNVYYI